MKGKAYRGPSQDIASIDSVSLCLCLAIVWTPVSGLPPRGAEFQRRQRLQARRSTNRLSAARQLGLEGTGEERDERYEARRPAYLREYRERRRYHPRLAA